MVVYYPTCKVRYISGYKWDKQGEAITRENMGELTYLLSGMSHQVNSGNQIAMLWTKHGDTRWSRHFCLHFFSWKDSTMVFHQHFE